jgi:cytochrome c peroxidase
VNRRLTALISGGLVLAAGAVTALEYRRQPAVRSEQVKTPSPAVACAGRAGLVSPARADAAPAVVALGRRLFDDRRLSADGTVSCASCHQQARAFTDDKPRAVGVGGQVGRRNTPQIFNLAYSSVFGWDGRAPTLEEAIRAALVNPAEMGMTDESVARALAADAGELGRLVGRGPDTTTVAQAIGAYVTSLRAGGSRADRYLYCADRSALHGREEAGLRLFTGRAHCIRCHGFEHEGTTPLGGRLALFTDNRFHNIGAGTPEDRGRGAVTGRAEDAGAFKTPTLRNVALTAPYMHDGSLSTLEAVVEFYNRGGGGRPGVDRDVVPLGLDPEARQALVAFLRALTSDGGPALTPAGATAAAGR